MKLRDQMTELFNRFGDVDVVTRDMLVAQADMIRDIGAKCRETGLFKHSQEQFDEFVAAIEADTPPEDRLVHSWTWLMNRIVQAPTSLHMNGAIVLTMPLVERYLPEETGPGLVVIPECDAYAPVGCLALTEIVSERQQWPEGATCATQEADGEVLYWDAPVETVIEGRHKGVKDGMISRIGIKHQVDAWYADDEKLQLARDWNTAVVTPEQINFL